MFLESIYPPLQFIFRTGNPYKLLTPESCQQTRPTGVQRDIMPKANILRQTPSTSNRQQHVVQRKTQPTILSRSNKPSTQTIITSTVVKMEPSEECDTIVVDGNFSVEAYTPSASANMHSYSLARSNLMFDRTPQVKCNILTTNSYLISMLTWTMVDGRMIFGSYLVGCHLILSHTLLLYQTGSVDIF